MRYVCRPGGRGDGWLCKWDFCRPHEASRAASVPGGIRNTAACWLHSQAGNPARVCIPKALVTLVSFSWNDKYNLNINYRTWCKFNIALVALVQTLAEKASISQTQLHFWYFKIQLDWIYLREACWLIQGDSIGDIGGQQSLRCTDSRQSATHRGFLPAGCPWGMGTW